MLEQINWIAIIVCVVVSMAIGAAWYSTLAKSWIKANGFTPEQVAQVEANDTPGIYVVAALCHLVMAIVLSGVIFHTAGSDVSPVDGLLTAFLLWLGIVATTMSINHRFQFKPWSLTLIDSGHFLLVMLAQGAIVAWFGF